MIDLRQATREDASVVARLNQGVQQVHADALPWMFKPPDAASPTDDDARALITRDGFVTFIAEIDGRAVGYAIAEERRRPESNRHYARNSIRVHEIGVAREARRRGVGRSLIEAVRDHGRAVGLDLLTLDTWQFNDGAQAFFKSCGLRPARVMMWTDTD